MSRSGVFRKAPVGYRAFYPVPLPPDPPLAVEGDLALLLSEADRALGAINTIASVLPSPDLLVAMFIQKEALLSSQIEGTQSSLTDVLGVDEDHPPSADVGEVVNYIKAMRYGLRRLGQDRFPMSLRLLREVHGVLMQQVRGGKPALTPGEFRRVQNWIGGANLRTARFIPPPVDAMHTALDNLEKYLYVEDELPVLVQCALIHYQFETIHPFNDGNGRLGRLLITYFLVWRGVLDEPMLYLSAYLKTYQQEYYDRLMQVRNSGNFEAWVAFFLEGIVNVSSQVINTTRRLQQLEREDTERLIAVNAGQDGIRLLRHLMQQPVVQVKDVARVLEVSYNKANGLVASLVKLGLLRQTSQGRRNRRFSYHQYIEILAEGTELTASDTDMPERTQYEQEAD